MNTRHHIESLCHAWRVAERARRHVENVTRLHVGDDELSVAIARLAFANGEVERLEKACGVRT